MALAQKLNLFINAVTISKDFSWKEDTVLDKIQKIQEKIQEINC